MSGNNDNYLKREFSGSRAAGYFMAFLITFTFVDLFQVKESAQHGSFDKFNRYFANSYPECVPENIFGIFGCLIGWTAVGDPESGSSPMVSVVLWTDRMLNASSKSWPLRMEEHARVLETILPLRPKAVLVDFFFLDDPENRGDESLEDLIDVICDYQETAGTEAGTKLYLSEPNPELGQLTTKRLTVGVKDTCGLDLTDPKQSDVVRIVSAVLSGSPSRIYSRDGAAARMFSSEPGMEDFHLFWASNSSQPFLDEDDCTKSDALFPGNFGEVLLKIAKSAFDDPSDASGTPCPYPTVMSAHAVHCLRAAPIDDVTGARMKELEDCGLTKDDYEIIKRTMKEKYVFYGAELHGLGDIYDVPIHDGHKLSGVFIHAMALDNLLETGGNVHFVSKERRWGTRVLYYLLSAFLATILFFIIKWAFFDLWHCIVHCMNKSRMWIGRVGCLALELLYWLVLVVITGAVLILAAWTVYLLAFLYEPFRFGVLNWVGILLVSGLLSVWVKIPFAEELAEISQICSRKHRPSVGEEIRETDHREDIKEPK